jgi:hypothetical protein
MIFCREEQYYVDAAILAATIRIKEQYISKKNYEITEVIL